VKNNLSHILKKIGISILAAIAFKLLFFRLPDFLEPDLLVIPFIVLILREGNVFIDRQLEKEYSWLLNPNQRILVQFVLSLVFSAVTLFLLMNLMHFTKFNEIRLFNRAIRQMFVPAIIITFLCLVIYISGQFFKAWKQSLLEVEKHKAESAIAQLQNLKNQLNPHFLFNNLSVLSSLVYQNQDKAVDFINELSKVYRYVLENKNTELASLQEELDFLEHYIYLLKIRFGNNISFDISIAKNDKQKYLPPMCLQTLVENTIQHNEASQIKPLSIFIFTENNSLIIQNPIQPRSDKVKSSETGLKNMEVRYQFFTDEKIQIIHTEQIFKVILPLIQRK
jgi:two-component system, LytTR family, sensor kinase